MNVEQLREQLKIDEGVDFNSLVEIFSINSKFSSNFEIKTFSKKLVLLRLPLII